MIISVFEYGVVVLDRPDKKVKVDEEGETNGETCGTGRIYVGQEYWKV